MSESLIDRIDALDAAIRLYQPSLRAGRTNAGAILTAYEAAIAAMGDASTREDEGPASLQAATSPVSTSEIRLVKKDEPDTLIMACQEVLRLMDKWRLHYAYSETCERAVTGLREEMQKHLRTTEPEKCPAPERESINLSPMIAELEALGEDASNAPGELWILSAVMKIVHKYAGIEGEQS